MKNTLKIITSIVIIAILLSTLSNILAVKLPTDGTNIQYNPDNVTNSGVKTKANSIMGTLVLIVQIACVVTMVFMGLRYMFASSEGKADVKKDLVVWCIGAFIVFGATTIVGLVLNVVVGDKQYVAVAPNEKSEEQKQKEEEKKVSDWAVGYWENAKNEGLIPASIKNKPKAKISRVEFAESIYILAEKYGVPLTLPGNGLSVSDEGLTNSEKNKILKLYNAGIVSGTGKDTNGNIVFNADADITREDVATIIYRMLGSSGNLETTSITEADKNDSLYSNVENYAKEAMVYMKKNEIIVGDENGNLNPKGNTTCEEAITILYRIYSGEK